MMNRTIFAAAAAVALIPLIANAQPSPPRPDANMRALQAVNGELAQAWTMSRAAMIALQDQVDDLNQQIAILKAQRAASEAAAAKALPPPAADPAK